MGKKDKRCRRGVKLETWIRNTRLTNANANNLDIFFRLLLVCLHVLDPMHYVQSLHRPPKYRMFPIQPRRLICCDEELACVRVRSRVRH